MDKNTITGLVLIVAIMIGFGIFNSKQAEKYNREKQTQDSISQVHEIQRRQELQLTDSVNNLTGDTTLQSSATARVDSSLQAVVQKQEEFYTIENNLLKITLTNIGGRIYSAEVKDYATYTQKPLILFNGEKNDFSFDFTANPVVPVSTSKMAFEPVAKTQVVMGENDTLIQLALRLALGNGYIEYIYKMRPDSYLVDLDVNFVGLGDYINRQETSLGLTWTMDSPQQEKGFSNENSYTDLAYKFPDETSIEKLSGRSSEKSEELRSLKINWIAYKQQFFSTILINKNNFEGAKLNFTTYNERNIDSLIKHFETYTTVPYVSSKETQNYALSFYLGTNHYNTLKSYDKSFEKLVPISWIGIDGLINKYIIIPIFNFFEKFISNYGIIILILTLLIKLVIFPFTKKSYVSMAKMRLLKPEIDKITAKYPKKEDAMKKQQETMAVYKKNGASMFGGCLPMLFQFPILIAMFRFFPTSFELRQKGFLWADDLSGYDSVLDLPFNIPFYGNHVSLFALLMAISMFFYTKITMASQSSSQNSMPGMKFMSLYFMPVMMLCFCNNFSSGLSYYYFLSNLITIGQMWFMRKFVVKDEDLLKKMQAHAKQPIKKSKFQTKLEEMQRQQQLQQKKRK
ncbi:MAG: membrane protein insertase YidC [Prevotellaceae bacterium]|jgi:YidC/Oxa1 family membrane protein insertase|nr:membrane protein insertase YidC [Prevotellaceae bacterium]